MRRLIPIVLIALVALAVASDAQTTYKPLSTTVANAPTATTPYLSTDSLLVVRGGALYKAPGNLLNIPTGNPIPSVPDESTLASKATSFATYVVRTDYAVGNGAPSLIYQSNAVNCTLNSGLGDGGLQVPASGGGCWNAIVPTYGMDVREWGAQCVGASHDDSAALAAAAASGVNNLVVGPTQNCYSSTGVTIPANTVFGGSAFLPGNPAAGGATTYSGSVLSCPNTAGVVCLTISGVSGGNSLLPNGLHDLVVEGVGTTPGAASKGIVWSGGYQVWSRNVKVANFDWCAEWITSSNQGIDAKNYNFNAGKCATHYGVNDGWAELRFFGGRFGEDGPGDFNTYHDFFYFENDVCTSGGCGPNTTEFYGTQFNPGDGYVPTVCAFNFGNFNGSGVMGDFRFVGAHVEVSDASVSPFFCSDATVKLLSVLQITDSSFANDNAAGTSQATFAMNAATTLNLWSISHTYIKGSLTLAPNPSAGAPNNGLGFHNVVFNDITGLYAVSLTSGGNDILPVMMLKDSTIGNVLTIAGNWAGTSTNGSLTLQNDTYGGAITDTATGTVRMNEPWQTFTATLLFGGASTGWTQSQSSGVYRRTSDGGLKGQFADTVSAKGSATGVTTISGVPTNLKCYNNLNANETRPLSIFSSMIGMAGTPYAFMTPGSSAIQVFNGPTATATAQMTDANFGATSSLAGPFSCAQLQ